MAEEHEHKDTYSANNKLVCDGCVEPVEQGLNECFDACHKLGKDICPRCERFHRK